MVDLKLAIYESILNNELDKETGYRMLDVYEERFFNKGPFDDNRLNKL